MKRSAQSLLFGPRRSRASVVAPVRRGRVHHVAFVVADSDYFRAVTYLEDNYITRSSELPGVDDGKAWEIMQDLSRWGWVDRGDSWSLSEAGRRALEIQRSS